MLSHVFPLNKRKHTLNALYTKDCKVIFFLHFNLSKGIFSTSFLTTQKSHPIRNNHIDIVLWKQKSCWKISFYSWTFYIYHTLNKECVIKSVRSSGEINGIKQYNIIGKILPLSVLVLLLALETSFLNSSWEFIWYYAHCQKRWACFNTP